MTRERLPGWLVERGEKIFRALDDAVRAEDPVEAEERIGEAEELLRLLRSRRRRLPLVGRVYVDALTLLYSIVDYLLTLRYALHLEGFGDSFPSPDREYFLAGKLYESVRGALVEYMDELLSLYLEAEEQADEEELDWL